MEITVTMRGTDRDIANAARTTISKEDIAGGVRPSYMKKMYQSEHSPIRVKQFEVIVTDVPYWIAMHFVRHNVGIDHFVSTQREDRAGDDRGGARQDALVTWKFIANSAAIITISRKRLCRQAHVETTKVWKKVLEAIAEDDYELFKVCQPECVYRGWCYEYKTCGYHRSDKYQEVLKEYRKGISGSEGTEWE